jgi:hypothetical protein
MEKEIEEEKKMLESNFWDLKQYVNVVVWKSLPFVFKCLYLQQLRQCEQIHN